MTQEPLAIEVEVVEIDGTSPPARSDDRAELPPRQQWQDWQSWPSQVRKLDSRWWPLWVILGTIAVLLLLTVGVFVGILLVIFRIVSGILRAVFR